MRLITYFNVIGSFDEVSMLGGDFDFKYFEGSIDMISQFFSSLTSSQSWLSKEIYYGTIYIKIHLYVVASLGDVKTFAIIASKLIFFASS